MTDAPRFARSPNFEGRGRHWLHVAAVATWLVCGVPGLASITTGRLQRPLAEVWVASFAVYGGILLYAWWKLTRTRVRPLLSVPLVVVQSAAGLAMVYSSGNATMAATLVIISAALPYHLHPGWVWLWIAVQSMVLGAMFWRWGNWIGGVSFALVFGGFQAFAAASSMLARKEQEAREQLGHVNAELQSTRALLAESSRVDERLRISRELHDALGHHLTALSLQLDVASRLSVGESAPHVAQAHAITKLLLADVRDVVSRMRDGSRADVASVIRSLAVDQPGLTIHLDMPEEVAVGDGSGARALVRCVQEAITNTVRHAQARNLWIRVEVRDGGITIHARDDGRGAENVRWGNGLRGMRERFEEYGGTVELRSSHARGFELRAFMPTAMP